jgi:hypothetical protein
VLAILSGVLIKKIAITGQEANELANGIGKIMPRKECKSSKK